MPEAQPSSPSMFRGCLSVLVIIPIILYLVISMNTGDMLWFWPVFKEIPVGMLVHCYGTDVEIQPGTQAFTTVTEAVNNSLTGVKRWDDTSMSDVTYQEYKTSPAMEVLEVHYDPPVTIHSQYAFMKAVNWLVIPLVGRHAANSAIFGIEGGYTDPGSYHGKSTTPIANILEQQGVCTKP